MGSFWIYLCFFIDEIKAVDLIRLLDEVDTKCEISSTNRNQGFPGGISGKESACQCRDVRDLIPGWGRCPGGGNGNPFQYSHLENPMDRGAWQATDHKITRVGHDLVIKPPPQQKLTQLCKATLAQLKKKKLLYPITLSVEAIKKNLFHSYKKEISLFS